MSRDLQLLRQFATTRDRDALGALYRRHYGSLYRVAQACMPRHQDARDAVHGAFLVAAQRCQGFRGEGSVRAWLLAITLNQSRNARRGERPSADPVLLDELRSMAPPVPAVIERAEAEEELLAALRRLPPGLREPLTLHYLEDMTLAEIGEVLGVPRSTVHDRCEKGLRALRGTLGSRAHTSAFAAAFAGLIQLPTSGKTVAGGVLMAWKLAACVAGVVLIAWLAWREVGEESPGDRGGTRIAAPAGDGVLDEVTAQGGATEPPEAPVQIPLQAYSEGGAQSAGPWEVKGVVATAGGEGIPGVTVRLTLYPGWYEDDFPTMAPEPLARADQVTGTGGIFTWGLPVPDSAVTIHLEAEETGYRRRAADRLVLAHAAAPQDLRLELTPLDAWVAGTVLAPDGTPVPGANVASHGGKATTDGRGTFRMAYPGSMTGRGWFRAWAPGYAVAEAFFNAPGPGETAETEVTLAPCWAIEGRVVDTAGIPVEGARATCWNGRPTRHVTGEDGRFRIDHLPHGTGWSGSTTVYVDAAGFAPVSEEVRSENAGSELVVRLHRGHVVRGVVLDSAGNPIVSARIGLGFSWEGSQTLKTLSDASGAFVFSHAGLMKDRFVLVQAQGYADAKVPLDPSEPDVRVVLQPERSVAGRVTDGDGRPLEGLGVALRSGNRSGGYTGQSTRTGGDGRFALGGIAEGGFGLEVYGSGWVRKRMDVRAGDQDIHVVMEPHGKLAGRVVAADTGEPIPQFLLRLSFSDVLSGDPRPFGIPGDLADGQVFRDPEGVFRIAGEFPIGGPYGVNVSADGYALESVPRVVATADPKPEDLTIRLRRAGLVRGRVVDAASGEAIVGASVYWRHSAADAAYVPDQQPASAVVVTDGGGRFRFSDVGTTDIWIHAARTGFASRIEGPVSVSAGQTRDVTIQLPAGAILTGRVLDARGNGRPDFTVTLELDVDEGYGNPREPGVRTDADGRFAFPPLPPGKARLSVEERVGHHGIGLFGGDAVIPAGGTVDVVLRPPGDAVLTVTVTGLGPEPGGVLTVVAIPDKTSSGPGPRLSAVVHDGVAVLDGLPAGNYKLHLITYGTKWRGSVAVSVEAGETMTCVLEAYRP